MIFGIGHGGQTKDLDGDEPDGYDEVIYPVDFRQTGHVTDDQQNPMSQPTTQNILRAMLWLVKDARPNDSLFFHYSGRAKIYRPDIPVPISGC